MPVLHEYTMTQTIKTAKRWLTPGMGLKRWLVLLFMGITVFAMGFGLFLRDLYGGTGYPPIIQILALHALQRWLRAVIFGSIGLGFIAFSLYQLNQTMISAFLPKQTTSAEVVEILHEARRRRQGPKIVTIGGGTGMSVLLRGLKYHTDNVTGIVTVADDGGSSGRLRKTLGVLPPGDFRNCITALADDESLMTQLFQYRFAKDNSEKENGLAGHSFGNLFITVMAEVTGSFEQALAESERILSIHGKILPSTLQDVTLYADVITENGSSQVQGESAIPYSEYPIERVYLKSNETPPIAPDKIEAFPGAIDAIIEADIILLGPGSLFTSLLPNLLVPEIAQAIRTSSASRIYICNVATQFGETDCFSLKDHIHALENHVGEGLISHVLVNNCVDFPIPPNRSYDLINPQVSATLGNCIFIQANVIDTIHPWRHDSTKLAQAILDWYQKTCISNN